MTEIQWLITCAVVILNEKQKQLRHDYFESPLRNALIWITKRETNYIFLVDERKILNEG